MCPHSPHCPAAEEPDREAARVIAGHPEQGWSLLCNGLIVFEDTGGLLPDCSVVAPHRSKVELAPNDYLETSPDPSNVPDQRGKRRRVRAA